MIDRIDIADPLAEICFRLGLMTNDVKDLHIKPGAATVVVYRRHPDHGGKFIEADKAATETHTFQVRT